MIVVYAKRSNPIEKNDGLEDFSVNMNEPWLIGGYFNSILSCDEREWGNQPLIRSMDDIGDILLVVEWMKSRLKGCKFACTSGRMWEKLDKVLVNVHL